MNIYKCIKLFFSVKFKSTSTQTVVSNFYDVLNDFKMIIIQTLLNLEKSFFKQIPNIYRYRYYRYLKIIIIKYMYPYICISLAEMRKGSTCILNVFFDILLLLFRHFLVKTEIKIIY